MRCSNGLAAGVLVAAVTVLAAAAQAATVQTERITIPEESLQPDAVVDTPAGLAEPVDEMPPPHDAPRAAPVEAPPPHDLSARPALPEVLHDPALLPAPVRELRAKLIAAATTGDIEKLRPLIEAGASPPVVSFTPVGDPIDYLRSVSGDPEGREILAILIEVLEAGYVHVDVGTPQEMYLWPYFARYPLEALSPEQMVEIFKLLTAGDFEDMKFFGAYIFYRLGIGPDGTWHFFVAGD